MIESFYDLENLQMCSAKYNMSNPPHYPQSHQVVSSAMEECFKIRTADVDPAVSFLSHLVC